MEVIWLCNIDFESSVMLENWRSAVIVPLYKAKGERIKCLNYRGISLLSVVRKIYIGIVVYRVCKVTEGFINDEQGGFTAGRGRVDQIFTLKHVTLWGLKLIYGRVKCY